MPGRLGVWTTGAPVNLLAVDSNPLEDLKLLTGQGAHLPFIRANGRIVQDGLAR